MIRNDASIYEQISLYKYNRRYLTEDKLR